MVLCILAGCGGSGNGNWQQIRGKGFSFAAPAGWSVGGTAASSGPVDRVEVQEFELQHPYTRAKRVAVAHELDGDAIKLAQQLKGTLSGRSVLTVAGFDARSYSIAYDGKVTEITFVLHGMHEFELLCRRAVDTSDSVCSKLVSSFSAG